jgi:hypothetical protein
MTQSDTVLSHRITASFVALTVALTACGDEGSSAGTDAGTSDAAGRDAGPGVDGGPVTDTGPRDGAGDDAGAATDGGPERDAGAGTDAAVDCAPATEGAPCTVEGAFCGGPCTDECSFCNILSCRGGTWMRMEVFPAPCFACGPTERCSSLDEYCEEFTGGPAGSPTSYTCRAAPAACGGARPTCACVEPGSGGTCSEADDGVTVRIFAP